MVGWSRPPSIVPIPPSTSVPSPPAPSIPNPKPMGPTLNPKYQPHGDNPQPQIPAPWGQPSIPNPNTIRPTLNPKYLSPWGQPSVPNPSPMGMDRMILHFFQQQPKCPCDHSRSSSKTWPRAGKDLASAFKTGNALGYFSEIKAFSLSFFHSATFPLCSLGAAEEAEWNIKVIYSIPGVQGHRLGEGFFFHFSSGEGNPRR